MPKNTPCPARCASRRRRRRDHQRHDAEDERERGHQDRPQAQPAGFDGGRHACPALVLELARELDDQDGVLGRQADEHDEADLRQDVMSCPCSMTPNER